MLFLFRVVIFVLLILWSGIGTAYAYIGPGAGFAFISSFLVLFLAGLLGFLTIITWPVRAIFIFIRRRRLRGGSRVKRIVILGLDGFDPELTERFMKNGGLPNFLSLKEEGSFRRLRTTTPSISPVAWSTFSTGVNPGKHAIFDFYTRDPKNYMPVLSSARISSYTKYYRIGPWKVPFRRNQVRFLRKSVSFWRLLGEKGIFSTILRVPITFPPEKFYGASLSAMCTPDLLGTQGTFTLYTTEAPDSLGVSTGGRKISIRIEGDRFKSRIIGPGVSENGSGKDLEIPFEGQIDYEKQSVRLNFGATAVLLKKGQYSPWTKLEFGAGLRKRVRGIARFLIIEMNPDLKIYMTPINIDPEKPALPISQPAFYSAMLAKLWGPFASLGLAEDTWALNERVIDEGAFLDQAYDIYEERKRHLTDALKKNQEGLVVSVFDTTDRIQHMFFRYLSPDHPANKGKDTTVYKDTIQRLYQKMDKLLGEIQSVLTENDLLIIVSDHGFKAFKWGINLNSWLWKEGYLVLNDGGSPDGSEWFANVDWVRTRAYAYGLSGIFLNIRGREGLGTVESGEEKIALQNEIRQKLEALWDERNGFKPIRRVFLAQESLKGPYTGEAPDILIGFEQGYRASWNSATGKITDEIVEENTRSWSGDHAIDPELVPGVFFSNWKLEDENPAIEDIAPTILNLFGLKRPGFYDGKILRLSASNGEVY